MSIIMSPADIIPGGVSQKEATPVEMLNLAVSMFFKKDGESRFKEIFYDPSISVYIAGPGLSEDTLDLVAVRHDGKMRCFNLQTDTHFSHIQNITPIEKKQFSKESQAFYQELKDYVEEIKQNQENQSNSNRNPQ